MKKILFFFLPLSLALFLSIFILTTDLERAQVQQNEVKLPQIFMFIGKREYSLIKKERDQILEGKTVEHQWHKVHFKGKKQMFLAKIRLKGDMSDHYEGEQWSYRVQLKNNTYMGLNNFSLQKPFTRGYLSNWFFQKISEKEGYLFLKIIYLLAGINEKAPVLYLLEEFFDDQTAVMKNRREGPILYFSQDEYWEPRRFFDADQDENPPYIKGQGYNYYTIPVKTYNSVKDSPLKSDLFELAREKLQAFRDGKLPASEVFELQSLAFYFALSDLFGTVHSVFIGQLKFYFDPLTKLLTVIPYDIGEIEKLKMPLFSYADINWILINRFGGGRSLFIEELLNDRKFYGMYLQSLEEVGRTEKLKKWLALINPIETGLPANILNDFKKKSIPEDVLENNQKIIRRYLDGKNAIYAWNVHNMGNNSHELILQNRQIFPIIITAIKACENCPNLLSTPLWLESKFKSQSMREEKIIIKNTNSLYWISYKYPGLKDQIQIQTQSMKKFNLSKGQWKNLVGFIKKGKTITNTEANITIKENLYVQSDEILVIKAGTRIQLEGGNIVAKGAVELNGTAEAPIFISSKSQGGILIVGAKQCSQFNYSTFDGVAPIGIDSLGFTGGINVVKTCVNINHSQFKNSSTEDMLNLVYTKFKIQKSEFIKSFSDAIDMDFSQGDVEDSYFMASGNDGLDLSGSQVNVRSCHFKGAKDKAISVGEKSTSHIIKTRVSNSKNGVVVKDGSYVHVEQSEFSANEVDFVIFKKKSEFDFPTLEVKITSTENLRYLLEAGSKYILNGTEQLPNTD